MATAPISDTDTRNDYTATASQTTFPYTFWIKDENHLDVYVNDVLQTIGSGNDYTVSEVQNVAGANVVFNSGLTSGDTVAIVYNPDIERQTEFTTSGNFSAAGINLELTYLISICQYLETQMQRAIRWADTLDVSGFNDFTYADPSGSAGYSVVVNSSEDGFEYNQIVDSTLVGNYESFVTDGDASTTTFAVGFTPVSVNSILVEVDGVILEPTVDYTISSSNVIFTSAPGSGTDNVVVRNLASGVAATTPADSSVTTAKIQNGAVTNAKLATGDTVLKDNIDDDLITNYTDTTIVASDEILFSDVSDSNNMKKDTVQGILDLVAPELHAQSTVTPTTSDFLYFGDASDSNNQKKALIDTILGLSSGAGGAYSGAWVNFVGTSGSINDSDNVTSVTDNGTGDWTVNITSNMANATYGYSWGFESSGSNVIRGCGIPNGGTHTAGALNIEFDQSSGTNVDPTAMFIHIWGDT